MRFQLLFGVVLAVCLGSAAVAAMSTESPDYQDDASTTESSLENTTSSTTTTTTTTTTTASSTDAVTLTGYSKWCLAHTDVHYHTFDYASIDYQGLCKHQLVSVCDKGACNRNFALPQFEIYFKGERRYGSWWPVSYPLYVEIHYKGTKVRLSRQQPYGVTATRLDGPSPGATIGPGSYGEFQLTSYWYYSYVYTGPPGLTVYFSSWGMYVSLDMIYWNSTCGICGNNNFNRNDDYCTKDGACPSSGEAIGDSWVVDDPEDPKSTCAGSSARWRRKAGGGDKECPRRAHWEKQCKQIIERQIRFLDPKFAKRELVDCVFDACNSDGAALDEFKRFIAFHVKLSEDVDDLNDQGGACVSDGGGSRPIPSVDSSDRSSASTDDSD